MIRIAPRKIVLLSAIAVLALLLALQTILDSRSGGRVLKTDGDIDLMVIGREGVPALEVRKSGDAWLVGEQGKADTFVKAEQWTVDRMLSLASTVKILNPVSSAGNGERFGFDTALSLDIHSSGKKVRSLSIGKTAVTPSQSYVRLDGSSEIVLVSGDYRTVFDTNVETLREKETEPVQGPEEGSSDPVPEDPTAQ